MTCWRGECQRGCYYPDACSEAALKARAEAAEARVAEFQWNALEMARKADIAEARADSAEAECERLRDALAEVRAVFDLQCPPMLPEKYVDHGAWVAHSWWNTVLGNVLNRVALLDDLAAMTDGDECSGLCGEHHWLDRPESDSRECLICGAEVAG